jgi:hypothetical protein
MAAVVRTRMTANARVDNSASVYVSHLSEGPLIG